MICDECLNRGSCTRAYTFDDEYDCPTGGFEMEFEEIEPDDFWPDSEELIGDEDDEFNPDDSETL